VPAAYALQLKEDECVYARHADLLGCDPIASNTSAACLTEVNGRDGACAVVRVQRSVQTANGIARRPPESDSCRLPGHTPHGTPREVHLTRDMCWRTLFSPVAPLQNGYPSALEKRAWCCFRGPARREHVQDRSEAGSKIVGISVSHSHTRTWSR
jgi:hypothetical protein